MARRSLGGNLKIMVSGSAALQPRLTRMFSLQPECPLWKVMG